MEFLININTQSTTPPKSIGGRFNVNWTNSKDILMDLGWRMTVEPPPPIENYERLTGVVYIQDPNDSERAIAQYTDTLIQDRLDAEAAEKIANDQQEIIDNLEQYVQQNVFILVCDALRGDNSHNMLTSTEIGTYMIPLRDSTDPNDYRLYKKYESIMNLINASLIQKKLNWTVNCTWQSDPTVVANAQALFTQLMGS